MWLGQWPLTPQHGVAAAAAAAVQPQDVQIKSNERQAARPCSHVNEPRDVHSFKLQASFGSLRHKPPTALPGTCCCCCFWFGWPLLMWQKQHRSSPAVPKGLGLGPLWTETHSSLGTVVFPKTLANTPQILFPVTWTSSQREQGMSVHFRGAEIQRN